MRIKSVAPGFIKLALKKRCSFFIVRYFSETFYMSVSICLYSTFHKLTSQKVSLIILILIKLNINDSNNARNYIKFSSLTCL